MTQVESPTPRRGLLHPGLISSGATLLIAALVTDIFYWRSLQFQWNNFSSWLLAGGLVLAALSAIALVIDLSLRHVRRIAWFRLAGVAAAALLSLLNAFVHSRDAYAAVVPEGIMLSAIVTAILLAVGLRGWSLEDRRTPLPQTRTVRP